MNSDDTLQAFLKNQRELFLNNLSSVGILDIGVIDSVNVEGRAHVTSSTFTNNRPIVYDDVEVIYPGNANGCFVTQCTGMACLIFIPKSCMPNVTDLKLRVGATSYNRDGIKVMPIGNGSNNKVRALFDAGGLYNVIGQEYTISYTEDAVSFQREDGTTSFTIDGTGQIYVCRQTDQGTLLINVEDTAVTQKWLSKDKDVLWTDTYNPDGSRSFVQSDPNNEEEDAEPWFEETHGPDGTTVRKWLSKNKDVRWVDTVNSDGIRSIVQLNPDDEDNPLSQINIAADGSISILTAKDVTFEAKGDTGVDLTVKGDVNLSAEGDVSVDAANINLNGDSKRLVTYAELKTAMDKLWIAMTTTPIAGNGSLQPSWTGITSIDISASETQTIKTGG